MSKTILITGAGSGFGKLAAFGLAKRGERVIATTQIWAQVTELRSEAKKRGLEIEVEKLDVTSERDRKRAAERWDADVLINNAGTMEAGPAAELPLDLLRSMFEINFFGNLALTQEFAAKMVKQRSGKIIFISSVAGLVTIPFSAGYSATNISASKKPPTRMATAFRSGVRIRFPCSSAARFRKKKSFRADQPTGRR